MPTKIMQMHQNNYPFDQSIYKKSLLIRQTILTTPSNKQSYLQQCKLAQKLSQNKFFIKLQTIMQEDNFLHLIFESIPFALNKYAKTLDANFLKQYKMHILGIANVLSLSSVITNLDIMNMGINQKYQPKYFLGIQFIQKKQVNIHELKNDYIEQITRIFNPYIINERAVEVYPRKYSKNLVKPDNNRTSDTRNIENMSLYIDPSTKNHIKTRKHESIYYERSKDQQLKARKQSYMSSVSNIRLNNLYKRINEIQLQVLNTKGPYQNNFKFAIEGRQITSKSTYNNNNSARYALQKQDQTIGLKYLQRSRHNRQNIQNQYESIENKRSKAILPNYILNVPIQQVQRQQYNNSIRSSKPSRYAIPKNLQLSTHSKIKSQKKFSTQFQHINQYQNMNSNNQSKDSKVNKKIQMFKHRQYTEMKQLNENTNFIHDFMNVLDSSDVQKNFDDQQTIINNDNNTYVYQTKNVNDHKTKIINDHKINNTYDHKINSIYNHKTNSTFNYRKSNKIALAQKPQTLTILPQAIEIKQQVKYATSTSCLKKSGSKRYMTQNPQTFQSSKPVQQSLQPTKNWFEDKDQKNYEQNQIKHNQIKHDQMSQNIQPIKSKGNDSTVTLQHRVKDAIQNSKKLILKLKQKSNKNINDNKSYMF